MGSDGKRTKAHRPNAKTEPVALAPGRHAWIQVARGAVRINGTTLQAGDGAGIENEPSLQLASDGPAEVLLFDLP